MNQKQDNEVAPTTEKRITGSLPLHRVWNALRDWRVRKRESSYQNYQETVQDYQQNQ
jgi:hypothetical protein